PSRSGRASGLERRRLNTATSSSLASARKPSTAGARRHLIRAGDSCSSSTPDGGPSRPRGYPPDMPLRIALAQIAPGLGALEDNLARHGELTEEARAGGADLVVFPELGLTGYQLQDLAAEIAMSIDDPRLAELAVGTRDLSAIVSFVEESPDHRL